MRSAETVKTVENLIAPVFDDGKYKLVDVEFVKEGSNWYLRVFADRRDTSSGGISIEDCEVISRVVEKILDVSGPIEQAYILEVSSPGIDRPLKTESDFKTYTGEIVDIRLYKARDGYKNFQGRLTGFSDGVVSIETDGGTALTFTIGDIAICRLAVIF